MPKIIENLESRLVEEARRQAWEGGYSAVTIRSVAAACGVGVGTVYNYFESKDALLAAFLLRVYGGEERPGSTPSRSEVCRSATDAKRRHLARRRPHARTTSEQA